MEYKGQSLQCKTLGNNITELIFDLQNGSVNKFDKNSLQARQRKNADPKRENQNAKRSKRAF